MVGDGSPILVVGASRSGTALVRSILNVHPMVHIAGETHYFDDLRVALGRQATNPLDEDGRRLCEDYFLALAHRPYGHGGSAGASPLPRSRLRELAGSVGVGGDAYFEAYCRLDAELEGRPGHRPRWGEKTPRHIFRLTEIMSRYPTAQAICMVRDPRAVIASYRDWEHQGGFDFDRDPGHEEALVQERERTRASYDPAIASLLWRSTVRAAETARSRVGADRISLIRYEDLVMDPESTARGFTRWLRLDFTPEMLEVPLHNSSFATFDAQSGISSEPLERWKRKLNAREVAIVQTVAGRSLSTYRYGHHAVKLSPMDIVYIGAQLPLSAYRAYRANRSRMGNVAAYLFRRLRLALQS